MTNYHKITIEFLKHHYLMLGKSWRTIAKELNVSDVLLINYAEKFEIESRTVSEIRSIINNIDMEEASSLYINSWSINRLAKKYAVSYSVMRSKLIGHGITLRNSGAARSLIINREIEYWKWAQYDWMISAHSVASVNQIANYVHSSRTLVNKVLSYFHIQPRKNRGPKSGHQSNPVFPQFFNLDVEYLRQLIEADQDAASIFKLTKEAVVAACVAFSISKKAPKVFRSGPALESLSIASSTKWQNKDFADKVRISNQIKYDDEEYRRHIAEKRAEHPSISSIQLKLYEILESLGIGFIRESEQTLFGHYSFDCLVPNYHQNINLLIEVQGDYWHNLDRVRNNDRRKFSFIDRYYPLHQIMYIWEHEFDNQDRLLNRLKSKFGLLTDYVSYEFGDLTVAEVKSNQVKSFIDAYHYIGSNRNGKAYAAMLNEEIVAAAIVTSPTRQNMVGRYGSSSILEIARFCISPLYQKRNLASWFLSRVVKLLKCDKVIAFADKTVGHLGTIYRAANFRLDHVVDPDYWYTHGSSIVIHKKTIYNRARAVGITESEYCKQYRLLKVFGGEKLAFVFDLV